MAAEYGKATPGDREAEASRARYDRFAPRPRANTKNNVS